MQKNDALVICTRNRSLDLNACLESLHYCSDLPGIVLVVDSSDGQESSAVCGRHRIELADANSDLVYLRTGPGLTHQRNCGLAALPDGLEYVYFVDDDCVVPDGYFSTIRATFAAHKDCVGAGATIKNVRPDGSPNPPDPSRTPVLKRAVGAFERAFSLDRRPGRVNSAAVVGTLKGPPRSTTEVQWLSGCSMAFRLEDARSVLFNEDTLRGYALGEDVEFSLRISRLGKLMIAPGIEMAHKASPTNRLNARAFAKMDTVNRYFLVTSFPARFRKSAYWRSIVGGLAKGVLRMDSAPIAGTLDGIRELSKQGNAGRGS